MLQKVKQYLFDRKENEPPTERILGRHLARELTDEEINEVAGADCCFSTSGKCDCYA